MAHEVEVVNVTCPLCERTNRLPTDKALRDLGAAKCGLCKEPLFRVRGEALPYLQAQDLSHPLDREALEKLKAIPHADKLLSKWFGSTLDKMAHFNLLANSLEISERQAPRLWQLYREAAGRINIEMPPLFVVQDPQMNAFAIGVGAPLVAVTSGLLDSLGEREIIGVLGHELTHVKLGHGLYRTLAMLIAQSGVRVLDKLLGIGAVLIVPLRIALMRWYQMSELSADRGELVASGCVDTFVQTHMCLAGGKHRFLEQLDVSAFIDQAQRAEAMCDNDLLLYVMEFLDQNRRSHPLVAWRVQHGRQWARTESFFHILTGQQ
jgi:Zn-dependent protease with chaperone function